MPGIIGGGVRSGGGVAYGDEANDGASHPAASGIIEGLTTGPTFAGKIGRAHV
jgi:hypothetical protein